MKNKNSIPIAIADDHAMFRDAITSLISTFSGFEVVVSAENGRQLLEKLSKAPVMPQICLLDIQMPVMNGYETIVELMKQYPSLKVLAVSMSNHEFSIIRMIKLGARGYLLKENGGKELQKALESIHTRGYYSSELVESNFFQLVQSDKKIPMNNINDREIEFLKLCCSEMNMKDIGKVMGVSSRTAEGYRNSLFEKLNLHTRVGLVLFAINAGLVADDVMSNNVNF